MSSVPVCNGVNTLRYDDVLLSLTPFVSSAQHLQASPSRGPLDPLAGLGASTPVERAVLYPLVAGAVVVVVVVELFFVDVLVGVVRAGVRLSAGTGWLTSQLNVLATTGAEASAP